MNNFLVFTLVFFSSIEIFSQTNSSENNFVLSSRWFHPIDNNDTISTEKAIKEFKPKRIDWIYTTDKKELKVYSDLNIPYSLALNPQIPDSLGYTTKSTRILKSNNQNYIAPWMVNDKIKNPYWGCVNNPMFVQTFYKRSKFLISLKPYALFLDDPEFNIRLKKENLVGCFCDYCVDGFLAKNKDFAPQKAKIKKKVTKYSKNKKNKKGDLILRYEKFQAMSVTNFLVDWKKEMLTINKDLKFLVNNYNGNWDDFLQVFDGGIAEINSSLLVDSTLNKIFAKAKRMNKTQLLTTNSSNKEDQYFLMKYCLKNNIELLIPWDLYLKDSKKRFFIDYSVFKNIVNGY